MSKSRLRFAIAAKILTAFALLGASSLHAQIFSSDLNGDGTGWTVTENGDTSIAWQFDYSTMGIPAAPNGSDTTGVRLGSNISSADPGGGSAIAISPGIAASGQYQVQFDFWLNYHANGSTEEGGGSVGFDGSAPKAGAGLLVNTDGDSGSDIKLFTNTGNIAHGPAYAIPSLNNGDVANTDLQAAFPSQTAPDAQGTGYTNQAGSFAFAWHTMLIDVDSGAQTATYSIDGFEIGTITGEDVAGDIALIHTDPFGSVAGDANLAFGVFDNVLVTQVPEPSSAALLLLAGLGLMARRRR